MPFLLPKPPKGTFRDELLTKRAGIRTAEDKAKREVRARDKGICRWPGCKERGERWRLEVAHLNDKGMGGDKGTRSTPDQLMLLCLPHHQGWQSLHSGELRIEPLTERGTNGPCKFLERTQTGWRVAGTEGKR